MSSAHAECISKIIILENITEHNDKNIKIYALGELGT